MKVIQWKFYLVAFVLLLCSFVAGAQNFRYIYIQTQNQALFYVKMGEQIISSSSSGYVIIPRLTEGSYKIAIGFSKSVLPELLFTVVLNDADAGYLIQNNVDQGLFVIELTTKKLVPTEMQWPTLKTSIKTKDEFARILSQVVGDSTINETIILKKPEVIISKSNFSKIPDNPIQAQVVPIIKDKPEIVIDSNAKILKLEQKNAPGSFYAKYVDGADTIDLFMPLPETPLKAESEQQVRDTAVVAKKEAEPDKGVKFIDMELQNPNKQPDSLALENADFVITHKKNALLNGVNTSQNDSVANYKVNKCKSTATQKDFLDLRKKMAAQITEAAMQKVVALEFNKTCFTSEHIKNLGVLFITEEERYKFYVLAYPHVSDTENFAMLQNQLTDNYYISRFKAMLNH